MALIRPVKGKKPKYGKNCWFAENATIVGEVIMGDDCSVWFSAVIRGDVNSITLGNKVNVQDGAVIHCTYQKHATEIGDNVSIAHNAVVHGCVIHDNVLVGMGAIIMDGCEVGSNCIIAAGSVVTQGMKLESGSIYAGIPAKKIKALDESLFSGEVQRIADNYLMYSSWYSEEEDSQ